MLEEPADLDRGALERVLEARWGLRSPRLEYLPLGFGSHHWLAVCARGPRRFVSVDDLRAAFQLPDADAAFAALERAFATAALLRDVGLEFVVAPLADAEGAVIRRLDDRYAVRVEPFVEGESSAFGAYTAADDRRQVAAVLARLHAATERVPKGLPRRETFAFPARDALHDALGDLDGAWDTGPFAEPARHLLRSRARVVAQRLEEYDALAARVRATAGSWVVTHGEPHRANVIRAREGGMHLVDWDTTLFAPRERDLHMVVDDDLTGWDEYAADGRAASLDPSAMRLYGLWWELSDIATFIGDFRRVHQRTRDTLAAWEILARNLEG